MSVFSTPEALLRQPSQFASLLLTDGPTDDISERVSNLIGWTLGVYIQYLKKLHDIDVTRFSSEAAEDVRPLNDELEEDADRTGDLMLTAHFLTFCEDFDESADPSGGRSGEERNRHALELVTEFIDRLADWASTPGGDGEDLQVRAREVSRELRKATRRVR